MNQRPFAIVTGASSGIGFELARQCAQHGYDLLIAADEASIENAAAELRQMGSQVDAVEADLATLSGVDALVAATKGRLVDALLANAGHGLGKAFLDQPFEEIRHVIDTNVTGTIYLIQQVGREMRARHKGRILITGSIAGYIPGTFQAVYNGTKAFIDSFSYALRNELKDSGVTVTCLMPGATETEVFSGITNLGWREAIEKHVTKEGAVKASEVGDTLVFMLSMPRNVNISEIQVRPTIDTTA